MPARSNQLDDKASEKPHYPGHRERLRERFYSAGPDALGDYELLEMALYATIARRDTKPLAKLLLKKFGSFAEVIHAPEARQREVEGIKDASINQLKLIAAAATCIAPGRDQVQRRAVVVERGDRLLPQRGSDAVAGRHPDDQRSSISQRRLGSPSAEEGTGA
jgi:DNA repair protein RadC